MLDLLETSYSQAEKRALKVYNTNSVQTNRGARVNLGKVGVGARAKLFDIFVL